MPRDRTPSRLRYTWRCFEPRDAGQIERQIRAGIVPCCPCCGDPLMAQPRTRLAGQLPLDAKGQDLDCRGCRRFWCLVQHTARSVRLLRMRRLVAAVKAVGRDAAAPAPAETVAA